jgi:predicted nuclease of predicted toxin-antitoxin system
MNFVADESIDFPIVRELRNAGHTVWAILEMSPGIDDDVVLDLANGYRALLLTADKDFGELVYRMRRVHQGVVLVRLPGVAPKDKATLVKEVVQGQAAELPHAFTVIARTSVRIRHR